MNSRKKGCRGELECAHYLTDRGFPARRTQQYCGTEGNSDVTCEALGEYHLEVKRTERLQLREAMEQAVRDSQGKVPIVVHRGNRTPWLVVMRLDDWLADVQAKLGAQEDAAFRDPLRDGL